MEFSLLLPDALELEEFEGVLKNKRKTVWLKPGTDLHQA